mgnify:FL=1
MTNTQSALTMNRWDRIGIILSVTCMIHCLLTPVAIIAIPAMAKLGASEESLHLFFAIFAIPVAVISLWRGYRQHKVKRPALYAVFGIALLWIAMSLHEPHWLESVVTGLGAILVIASHMLNHKLTRHC